MHDGPVRWQIAGPVATLWLHRPPMNLLGPELRQGLLDTLQALQAEAGVRCLVLTGAGDRAFSAGADLAEEARLDAAGAARFRAVSNQILGLMLAFPVPIIAAIHGFCMGGGFNLALHADIRLAADNARLAASGVKMGLVTGAARLTHLLGEARAKDLILTGRTIAAEAARAMGLVSRVVSPPELLPTAWQWAKTIAARPPLAVQAAKAAVGAIPDLERQAALDLERREFLRLFASNDHRRAVAALLNKERPEFRGD